MSFVASVHVRSRAARYAQDIRAGHHFLVADEPESLNGGDQGFSPYALLLSALGACTSITLRMYAERNGWELGVVSVALAHFKEGDVDRIERKLHFEKPLTDMQRARLVQIAQKTPVTKTLLRGVTMTTAIEDASEEGSQP